MKRYYFYSRYDKNQEPINKCYALSRYNAALYFADQKRLTLKAFLSVYTVSR